jgi:hypothetical protein
MSDSFVKTSSTLESAFRGNRPAAWYSAGRPYPAVKRLGDAEKPLDTKAELSAIRLSGSYPVQSQAVNTTKSPTLDNNT